MIEDQFGEVTYLNYYEEFDKISLHKLFGDLYAKLDEAEQAGFKDPYVVFESTIDPYDPLPGPVEIQVRGQRKLTVGEELELKEEERIEALSKKLGVTFYEASVIDRAQKVGKVKLND